MSTLDLRMIGGEYAYDRSETRNADPQISYYNTQKNFHQAVYDMRKLRKRSTLELYMIGGDLEKFGTARQQVPRCHCTTAMASKFFL